MRPVAAAEMFCTIMSMLIWASASASKMRAASPDLVGHADDGDLGLAAVVGDAGDDRLLHVFSLGLVLDCGLGHHPGAFELAERRADVDRDVVAAGVLHAAQVQHLGAAGGQLQHLLVGDPVELARVRDDARVGGEDAVDVGVDLADVGVQGGRQRDRGGVGAAAAERGDVLGVLADALEAGDDRDVAVVEGGGIRPGVTSMILALPCTESVITPACEPVNDRAVKPRSAIAIASSAIEIRSPAVSSMSSSRAGGSGVTSLARSSSSSVLSPIAETTTTTSCPARLALDDPLGHPLDAGGVGEGGAAVLLHDNAHNNFLTGTTTRPAGLPRPRPGFYRGSTPSPSNISLAAATCSSSPANSSSRRSWATIDWRARRAALALLPHEAT